MQENSVKRKVLIEDNFLINYVKTSKTLSGHCNETNPFKTYDRQCFRNLLR